MTLRPSTAESTDMAGVIMASPKKKAAPIMPSASTKPPFVLQQRFDQHDEREDSAFAAVVGPHQEDDVFQRDDEDQRPDQQRGNAQHGGAQVTAGGHHGMQRFAHGIERAGSDVAEDHADRGEGKLQRWCG